MFNASLAAYGGAKLAAAVQKANTGVGVSAPATVSAFVTKSVAQAVTVKVEARQATVVEKVALENAVKKLNELVAPSLQSVQFAMDEEEHRVVVKVVDTATHKVLRQIPNEEVLAFSKTLGRLQGLVVREKA